jgi:DNA-binding response OmpR family regulator
MPVMRNGLAHLDGRASSPPTDRGTIRVLIADDDPGIRGLLRAVLTDAGITAVEAADGREARRLIADHPPDVVLIDWVMEDGGLPLARELVDAHCMNGRVIMLTGLLDPRDRRAARRVGIEHFFVKPPDIDRLIAAIRAAASATTRAD